MIKKQEVTERSLVLKVERTSRADDCKITSDGVQEDEVGQLLGRRETERKSREPKDEWLKMNSRRKRKKVVVLRA